jgi:hypothetical protein
VDRWCTGCPCTPGDTQWKLPLRQALGRLAARIDALYEAETANLVASPWKAEEQFIRVRLGAQSPAAFWMKQARSHPGAGRRRNPAARDRALALLEGQFYRHLMFSSCAFFHDDLDRIEPRNAIALGLRAIQSAPSVARSDLEAAFAADLAYARSARTGRSGADLLQQIRAEREARAQLRGAA